MKAETPEQQIERILNLRLDLDNHKKMYQKFGHEIWDLAKVCELWYDEDISNSRMRELIGIYLWNSRQELLREIIGEIEKEYQGVSESAKIYAESGMLDHARSLRSGLSGIAKTLNILTQKLKEEK